MICLTKQITIMNPMTFKKRRGMRTINAAPSTVGEILYEEFLKPLDMPPEKDLLN